MRVGEDDLPSLEYIEDPYIPKLDPNCFTPSLDEVYDIDEDDGLIGHEEQHWSDETELYLRSLTLDQILGVPSDDEDIDPTSEVELQTVETEFNPPLSKLLLGSATNRRIRALFNRRKIRDVRVTFIDFSKPYLARISSGDNYKSFLNIGSAPGKRVVGA
ncbi:AGAP004869-PA [Anopheles gambiae str. PEST]|uniref:AGAP004869-PA n=1 Tax=Anopheles gambiae TaxID=7165 RepID=A7UTD7_ANOGA|nr:AGAP004869-PA [Anopheles gambiae str. PEST]